MARAGYVARSALFLLVGGLAAAAAAGLGGEATDPSGAMVTVAHAPAGRLILAVLAPALLVHAGFRAALMLVGEPYADRGPIQSALRRITNGGIGVLYLGLAITAGALALGIGGHVETDKNAAARDWSASVLSAPHGRYLLMGVAIAILIATVVQLVRVVSPDTVRRRLRVNEMSERTRDAVSAVGRIALLAKAAILSLVGYFLIEAAVQSAPRVARGPGGALHAVWEQPHGGLLLALMAAGLVAFGAYGLIEARWRRLF